MAWIQLMNLLSPCWRKPLICGCDAREDDMSLPRLPCCTYHLNTKSTKPWITHQRHTKYDYSSIQVSRSARESTLIHTIPLNCSMYCCRRAKLLLLSQIATRTSNSQNFSAREAARSNCSCSTERHNSFYRHNLWWKLTKIDPKKIIILTKSLDQLLPAVKILAS